MMDAIIFHNSEYLQLLLFNPTSEECDNEQFFSFIHRQIPKNLKQR